MNVGQLKAALADLPDDLDVTVRFTFDEGSEQRTGGVVTADCEKGCDDDSYFLLDCTDGTEDDAEGDGAPLGGGWME